jgi:hypothetical protein
MFTALGRDPEHVSTPHPPVLDSEPQLLIPKSPRHCLALASLKTAFVCISSQETEVVDKEG